MNVGCKQGYNFGARPIEKIYNNKCQQIEMLVWNQGCFLQDAEGSPR